MTTPQIVWLVVGATTSVGLLAVVIGLFRQVKRLGKAVVDFSREIQPTLQELRREADRAQERSTRLTEQGQALRESSGRTRR